MRRLIFLSLLLLLVVPVVCAQRVEYYQLYKVVNADGSSETRDGNSGQFVTRNKEVCYDSDNTGSTIGNGTLKLVLSQGNATKYRGSGYFGDNITYTFYDDRGLLNIEDDRGNVYVLRRTTAPAGRTTCSYIRDHSDDPPVYVPPVTNVYNYNTTNNYYNGSSHRHTSDPPRNHFDETHSVCYHCKGTGKCQVCGGDMIVHDLSGSHKCHNCHHGECSVCHGRKYLYHR